MNYLKILLLITSKDLNNSATEKKYDGVVFHRVIDGFMAQTGDVQFGNSTLEYF